MIVTKILGGLGNQMFQYSAGTQLALANGCQLKLDISGFNNYGLHNGYELGLFNIKTEIATMQDVSTLASPSSRLARLLRKTIGVGKKRITLKNILHSTIVSLR